MGGGGGGGEVDPNLGVVCSPPPPPTPISGSADVIIPHLHVPQMSDTVVNKQRNNTNKK